MILKCLCTPMYLASWILCPGGFRGVIRYILEAPSGLNAKRQVIFLLGEVKDEMRDVRNWNKSYLRILNASNDN